MRRFRRNSPHRWRLTCHLGALLLCLLLSRPDTLEAKGLFRGEPVDRFSADMIGIHLLSWTSDSLLVELGKVVPTLAAQGVNLIVLEVDYSFDFQSHPELRGGSYITRDGARAFAEICRRHGIRLVPQFQSLGHQSWASSTGRLLTEYPEFDITPGAYPGNEGIYCREWDPTNPRVNEIVFPLIDEIVDAFDADAIHIGMDEVFLLGDEKSPNTVGKDPAVLFARVVNEFHDHFVKKRGLEMFMWGDRLIDGLAHSFGSWEASHNGTHPAVDMIPTDIVVCDWHYNPRPAYTSIPMFIEKGFRVLPSSWRDIDGVRALTKYSYGLSEPLMAGHLFTTWSRLTPQQLAEYEPLRVGVETIRSGRYYDVTFQPAGFDEGSVTLALAAPRDDLTIRYTTDGTDPTLQSTVYEGPIRLDRSARVRAAAWQGKRLVADVTGKQIAVHRATGRPVSLTVDYSPKYEPDDGVLALVNGIPGSDSYADGQWVGAEGTGLEATIDLGRAVPISHVHLHSLNNRANWVHQATHVDVSGSTDGEHFEPMGSWRGEDVEDVRIHHDIAVTGGPVRFVRVTIPARTIPEGHDGAGSGAWLFVDEIIVE